MKKYTVAFCCNISELNIVAIKNSEIIKIFPGAYWLHELYKIFNSHGIEFISGDIALESVKNNTLNPRDIIILQEADSFQGYKLIKLGSIPFIITCFESPLYAYKFYDNINLYANKFPIRFMFKGVFYENNFLKGDNLNLLFPNFFNHFEEIISWNNKRDFVLVASNKKIESNIKLPKFKKKRYYIFWVYETFLKFTSKSRKKAIKGELLSKRINFINKLKNFYNIDIYGDGWDEFLTPDTNNNKVKILGKCLNKNKVLSNYKFCICFENIEYDGYITEKIIDCFASKTIPIYCGAPDVKSFIPKESFIDVRDFFSTMELINFLRKFDEVMQNDMLKYGEDFLRNNSDYSHQGFANKIYKKFLEFHKQKFR